MAEQHIYGFLCPHCGKHFGLYQSAADHIRAVHAIENAAAHGERAIPMTDRTPQLRLARCPTGCIEQTSYQPVGGQCICCPRCGAQMQWVDGHGEGADKEVSK